jgi:aryl-phospho-beta-D-glucosidase BglC (GH1 family)
LLRKHVSGNCFLKIPKRVVTDTSVTNRTQLATKYKSQSKVIFGVMNEPHDLDVPTWATTVQAAVTAIRQAGATSQMSERSSVAYLSGNGPN